jgi:calcineurin-like phosphoesterase family protein
MSSIFFTSDEHHGHFNIIKFCNRPFPSLEDMTEKLIYNHNEVVKAGDRVYHLGDMFWRTFTLGHAIETMSRLNGQHYYIYGNHDELFKSKELRDWFIWCKDVENLKVQGYPNIWLSHYAHRVWNGSHRGAYHLYGHTHNVLPEGDYLSMDVGVDAQNFYPISLEDVDKVLKKKKESLRVVSGFVNVDTSS